MAEVKLTLVPGWLPIDIHKTISGHIFIEASIIRQNCDTLWVIDLNTLRWMSVEHLYREQGLRNLHLSNESKMYSNILFAVNVKTVKLLLPTPSAVMVHDTSESDLDALRCLPHSESKQWVSKRHDIVTRHLHTDGEQMRTNARRLKSTTDTTSRVRISTQTTSHDQEKVKQGAFSTPKTPFLYISYTTAHANPFCYDKLLTDFPCSHDDH